MWSGANFWGEGPRLRPVHASMASAVGLWDCKTAAQVCRQCPVCPSILEGRPVVLVGSRVPPWTMGLLYMYHPPYPQPLLGFRSPCFVSSPTASAFSSPSIPFLLETAAEHRPLLHFKQLEQSALAVLFLTFLASLVSARPTRPTTDNYSSNYNLNFNCLSAVLHSLIQRGAPVSPVSSGVETNNEATIRYSPGDCHHHCLPILGTSSQKRPTLLLHHEVHLWSRPSGSHRRRRRQG